MIGVGRHMIGLVKQAVGKLVGDIKLQVDGKAERLEGKQQNVAGSVKHTVQR
ncbi:MAG: CsbD family protein [Acetobacteraceae bacterium]